MTLTQQFQQSLARLTHFSTGEQPLEIDDGPLRLRCRLVALDSLACAFDPSRDTATNLRSQNTSLTEAFAYDSYKSPARVQ